jgi:protein phosphatase 1 regulatory subunit 3A/B/C/D/E
MTNDTPKTVKLPLRSSTAEELKKAKKKVVFADDLGYTLAQIKIMTEPSDMPPKLRSSIVRTLLGEANEDSAKPCSQWTLSFKQPASDYLAFRRKVNERNVALENVLLKNEQCRISGTVKVKNLSFEKNRIRSNYGRQMANVRR